MQCLKRVPLLEKPLSSQDVRKKQFGYTCVGAVLLAVLAALPLYGVSAHVKSHPMDALFGIHRATLFHLGFKPLLTAGTVVHLLAFSYKEIDTRRATIVLSEALVVYYSWSLPLVGVLQLLLINVLVAYLDDAMTSYALLSGYTVLQLFSAGSTLAVRMLSPLLRADGSMQGVLSEAYFNGRANREDVLGCVSMCLLIVVILYARSLQVHIPIHKGRHKTYYAIPMLYSSTQPIFWYMTLQDMGIRFVQYFNLSSAWVTLPDSYLQHPTLTFVSVFLCAACVVGTSKIWMQIAEKTPRDVSKQITDSGFLVRGVRKSSTTKHIHHFIEDAAFLSSAFIFCVLLISACLKPWLGAMQLFIVLPSTLALHEKRTLQGSRKSR